MTREVICVADVKAVLGEGPVWIAAEQALYWVDIEQRHVLRWTAGEGARTIDVPACSLAPRASGGFIGAGHSGFFTAEEGLGEVRLVGDPESALESNRFNDGKTDRQGRFWAGTMDRFERESSGKLYRLDPDLRWTKVDSGYRVTNGPAFSLDGRTMFHTDSALQRIYAFDLAENGAASNRRLFRQFGPGEGYPDGMTVDSQDCLWIAFWDGWCVRRLSPGGETLEEIALPVQQPTSCAFGGPGLDQLFVTSARRGLGPEALERQPQAGGLFVIDPGVAGVPETPFAG
jgi:xylono-1,5-lactonase